MLLNTSLAVLNTLKMREITSRIEASAPMAFRLISRKAEGAGRVMLMSFWCVHNLCGSWGWDDTYCVSPVTVVLSDHMSRLKEV